MTKRADGEEGRLRPPLGVRRPSRPDAAKISGLDLQLLRKTQDAGVDPDGPHTLSDRAGLTPGRRLSGQTLELRLRPVAVLIRRSPARSTMYHLGRIVVTRELAPSPAAAKRAADGSRVRTGGTARPALWQAGDPHADLHHLFDETTTLSNWWRCISPTFGRNWKELHRHARWGIVDGDRPLAGAGMVRGGAAGGRRRVAGSIPTARTVSKRRPPDRAANYLDASIRSLPPQFLEGSRPDFQPRPALPGRKSPDQLVAELDVPRAESGRIYFAVWRSDGALLHTSSILPDVVAPDPNALLAKSGPHWRGGFRDVAILGPRAARILVGTGIEKELGDLRLFAWQLAGAGGLALGLGMLGGWWLSSRIVRPIRAISATAASISAADLSRRIDPAAVEDEFAELAETLNSTFDRLEAAFDRQTQFTADASHGRTPLTIIRTQPNWP